MPVTNVALQSWPNWSELTHFDIVRLASGQVATIEQTSERCRIVIVEGGVQVGDVILSAGDTFDAPAGFASLDVTSVDDPAVIVSLHGHWGDETGGCGVFTFDRSDAPENRGTPVDYERHTRFDAHYHDCDEFWILIDGEAVAVSEGTFYHVGPGDCVITGAGDHHDFADVGIAGRAVFFETRLIGQKRRGHLWEHTHGTATPVRR